jgi:type II secretory pathway pseudopilin PulG
LGARASFTLLELLVSLGIILILATLTMRLLNATLNSDRIRNGAREFQTFLAGARDRAVYAGQPRGVRLIQDPLDRSAVHSFVYIGAPSTFTDGTQITVNTAGSVSTITFSNPQTATTWGTLVQRGLLTDGAYITLGGTIYTMARNPVGSATWQLTTTTYTGTSGTPISYTLQLLPSPLSGEEPRTLPQNIVIDLDNSVLPPTWGSPGALTGSLDVLFSPNGTVTGTVAAAGRIHFVFSEYTDASVPLPVAPATTSGIPLLDSTSTWQANTTYTAQTSWVVPNPQNDLAFQCIAGGQSSGTQPPQFFTATPGSTIADGGVTWQCYNPKPRLIVSLATSSGRITTSPVYPNDKFRYAEIGEVTQ